MSRWTGGPPQPARPSRWRSTKAHVVRPVRAVRRVSLLTRFGLVSLILLTAVGVVLGSRLQANQRERTLRDSVNSAQIIAEVGIRPLLDPTVLQRDFLPIPADEQARLDLALASSVTQNGVVRIKIWNLQHWIVYSDNPKLVGRWFPSEQALDDAFAGKTTSQISDLSAPEELEEREFGSLLAVYVPLRIDTRGAFTSSSSGRVIGAFEIYLPYQPILASIDNETRELYLALTVGLLVLWICLFRLVSGASRRLRRNAAESTYQATHDELTGLANRRHLSSELDRLLAPDSEAAPAGVALALLDLDHFKEINDTLGHHHGDEVLRTVARRLATGLDATCVARLGGDEFVVVVANVADGPDAMQLCQQIELLLAEPINVSGIEMSVHASIGVVLAPDHGTDGETLLQHADVAMYVAKRSGTGRRMYSPDFDHYSPERLGLAAQIRGAIAGNQITVDYQPKLDVTSCQVLGVEALVRWQHPERGLVMPGEFLPIIEHTELIGPLTWHVLDLALAQCAEWRRQGVELVVAVNLSARTVSDPSLTENVRAALARHQLPGAYLELEITESAVLDDLGRARETLHHLRSLGVKLSIDDFGTGYASIKYLTELPLDVLKIDRSFVGQLLHDPTAAAVVTFTLDLARHLRLKVVAEGVEDEQTLAELLRLGCDLFQGYLIARPLPADEMLGWISRWYAATSPPQPVTERYTPTPVFAASPQFGPSPSSPPALSPMESAELVWSTLLDPEYAP